jgi:hypothetical protein
MSTILVVGASLDTFAHEMFVIRKWHHFLRCCGNPFPTDALRKGQRGAAEPAHFVAIDD